MNEEITLCDIIKAIYQESQTNLLDDWLRESCGECRMAQVTNQKRPLPEAPKVDA